MNTITPLLGAFDVVMLLPFAIFGVAALVVWILLERWAVTTPRAEVRLEALRRPRAVRRPGGQSLDAQPDAVSEAFRESIAIARDRRSQLAYVPQSLASLAKVHLALGERTQALSAAREAIDLARSNGCIYFEAHAEVTHRQRL